MPRLVIKKGDGVGRDHVLSGHPCVVGRDPAADFTLEDTVVSRRHFRVWAEGGTYWLEDLGSTNGTIVNDRRLKKSPLGDGDVIRVGTTQIAFVQKGLFGSTGAPAPLARRRRR